MKTNPLKTVFAAALFAATICLTTPAIAGSFLTGSGAPAVGLGGVAREVGFEPAIQDALDAEAAVAEAQANVENKRVARDQKVATLQEKIALVVNGVIGNPAYGPDSDLYGAMGYVRKSQRASGLTQRGTTPPAPPAP